MNTAGIMLARIMNLSNEVVCLFLFAGCLKKRPRFPLRAVLTAAAFSFLSYEAGGIEGWVLTQIAKYALFAAAAFVLCEVTLPDAFTSSVWILATEQIVFTAFCLAEPYLPRFAFSAFGHYLFLPLFDLAILPILWFAFLKKIAPKGKLDARWMDAAAGLFAVFPASLFNHVLFDSNSYDTSNFTMVLSSFFIFLCSYVILYILRMNRLQGQMARELAVIEQMWAQKQNQYEISKTTIDVINRKCHDLKHQLNAVRHMADSPEKDRYLKDVESSIGIYDSAVNTGNPALDTLLTEKSLYCQKYGIQTRCMIEGDALSFMDIVDMYTLFGNALDNAIECVQSIKDPDLRLIDVSVRKVSSLVSVTIENYMETPPLMENGAVVTSKKDRENHGFGLKSIVYTVEKYGGTCTIRPEGHLFTLSMMFPLPEKGPDD